MTFAQSMLPGIQVNKLFLPPLGIYLYKSLAAVVVTSEQSSFSGVRAEMKLLFLVLVSALASVLATPLSDK